MSLISALSTSLGSLKTLQQSVSVISNNIANAGTAGYTRKEATLESILLGADFGGVKISGYSRSSNDTVLNAAIETASDANKRGTQNDYLSQVQQLFGSNIDNPIVSSALDKFSAAWAKLQASPEDVSAQREVVQRGKEFAAEVRRLAAGVENLDRSIQKDLSDTTVELNAALKKIKELNDAITTAAGLNQPYGDYQDQRDQQLQKLASYTGIKVFQRDQSRIAVYTADGYMLLDGSARQFDFDGTNIKLSGTTNAVTSNLSGGKIEALYKMRYDGSPATASTDGSEEVIRKLRSQLDTLASAFLSTSTSGTFGYAYDNGAANASASPTEQATGFFTGSGRTTIDVASGLLDGSRSVKVGAAAGVVASFTDYSRSFSPDGLSASSVSYGGYAQAIVSAAQQAASNAKSLSETAKTQSQYYDERLKNDTGVNIDEEMIQLQIIQNSYQANARLVSVINTMFEELTGILR